MTLHLAKQVATIALMLAAVVVGAVAHLPFRDGTFDLVSAVETHYYWRDLEACTREVARVLKPGGRLVIIAETYKGRGSDALYQPVMKLLQARYLSAAEH